MLWHSLRWLYSTLFTLLLPWVFFRLWVRSLKFPAYRHRWLERLGYNPFPPLDDVLWIHAVSVGESLAAIPIVHRFRVQSPNTPILITTTTPTGSERVQAAFKDMLGKQIYHCYFPYDLPWILTTFFQRINPKLLIIMETELWPNLLYACEKRKLPILIANARLSPKSVRRYHWLGNIMKSMAQGITGVAAQSAVDAQRFHSLGVPTKRIWDTGNIKFDLQLPAYLQAQGREFRQELGQNKMVWIAASTHEGEEVIMLNTYSHLKKRFPNLLLLLVPRHPDRFNKVAQLCIDRGFEIVKRSQKQPCTDKTDIFFGDTMGEMPLFYAASDVAFVGGSFVPVGGHNLLEPAALGLPVLTGPQLFNFVAISEMLVNAKGATIVQDEAELTAILIQLLANNQQRIDQGQRAKYVVEENRGALERLLQLIENFWQQTPKIKVS